jgi:hypothetical protein
MRTALNGSGGNSACVMVAHELVGAVPLNGAKKEQNKNETLRLSTNSSRP